MNGGFGPLGLWASSRSPRPSVSRDNVSLAAAPEPKSFGASALAAQTLRLDGQRIETRRKTGIEPALLRLLQHARKAFRTASTSLPTALSSCILPFCEVGNGLFDDGVILKEHVVQPSLIGCVDGVAYSISQKYMPLPSLSELAACSSKGLAALSQVIDVPLSNSIRGIRTP
ncbi:hypothetical protein BDP67DRAFT_485486 [Colletotrichum lupini]|nr:hypothetical protein BDP67DRAFT_485486 [Colletotrichum lupini]